MDKRSQIAFHTLGRIQAILEMMDNPNVYRMPCERALELIRKAMTDREQERAKLE